MLGVGVIECEEDWNGMVHGAGKGMLFGIMQESGKGWFLRGKTYKKREKTSNEEATGQERVLVFVFRKGIRMKKSNFLSSRIPMWRLVQCRRCGRFSQEKTREESCLRQSGLE